MAPTSKTSAPVDLGSALGASSPIPDHLLADNGTNGNGSAAPAFDLQVLEDALQAVRGGDFSIRLSRDHIGSAAKIADAFNEIVAANERMARQLEEVGQVVGREGKTRKRVRFGLSQGSWGDMELSVNTMIDDLLWPTTAVTRAIAAVARGDLLQTVPIEVDGRPLQGEFLRSANIVNTMIKQLNVFTSEVTRVAREVGTDGKLGGQAQVREVTGVWKDLTESVNSMASNLTAQVRNIAEVTIAVANGDLSKKITVDVRGEILQLKEAINTMVDQLRGFASEVTRVAREVGTEGKLGGQAIVPGVAGTWKDLTDSVNAMCGNLTDQVRNIAQVTTAVVTSAMFRTWPVRLPAIRFTLSVRSAQVPATPSTCACPPSLPSVPTSRATRVTSEANPLSWSTIVLMVFFSSRISPRTSTVIFFDKSPLATAIVTSAMLRTCPVRLAAMALTLSVRSFQVPPTPGTCAWPPSLPSVPTSRATRVTSDANADS